MNSFGKGKVQKFCTNYKLKTIVGQFKLSQKINRMVYSK
jgi:hypothetical protein